MKHGILHLQTPDLDFPQDLTICVDVESNAGDTELSQKLSFSSTRSSTSLSRIVYGRMELRSLRKLVSSYIAPTVFNRLQSLCILRKRGNRGGYRRSGSSFQSIRSLGNLGGQRLTPHITCSLTIHIVLNMLILLTWSLYPKNHVNRRLCVVLQRIYIFVYLTLDQLETKPWQWKTLLLTMISIYSR